MEDLSSDALRRELVVSTSPVLKEKTIPFDFKNPPMNPVELQELMVYNLMEHYGVGLAAPQICLPWSVFAMGDPRNKDSIIVLFNPNIVDRSEEIVKVVEGCLSFPYLMLPVKRPTSIRIRYADHTGDVKTVKMDGITARIAQHEYDHLQGVLYTSKVSSLELTRAKQKQKKLKRRA